MVKDIKPVDKQPLTFEQLPKLLPQQQRMLHFIINGDNYTTAYKKAGYESKEYANRSAYYQVSHNPLKAHLDYYSRQLAKTVTPEYLINKLNVIAQNASQVNEEGIVNGDLAIKAIGEINKMLGHYAATKVDIQTVTASIQDIRNARKEYKKDR